MAVLTMTPEAWKTGDRHRRRLAAFARWMAASAASPDHLAATLDLCRRLDAGGLATADRLAALDALDDLLAEGWGHATGPETEPEPAE